MKMALTVNDMIDILSKIEDKDMEVWLKGTDGILYPCNESFVDEEKKCLILKEKRPFEHEMFDNILRSLKKG